MTRANQKRIRTLIYHNRLSLIMVLVLVTVSFSSLFFTQKLMLENARMTGNQLVRSYSEEEEKNFNIYNNLIRMMSKHLEEIEGREYSEEELRNWFFIFFDRTKEILPEGMIDPCAVIDGKLIAFLRQEDWDGFDYGQTEWYAQAVAAGGEVIFTDAYVAPAHEGPVITIAQAFGDGKDVLAFHVLAENFNLYTNQMELPENASYYVCDSKGDLLYKKSVLNANDEQIGNYARFLFNRIQGEGELEGRDSIRDLNNQKRAAYSHKTVNGWVSILTMPYSTLLKDFYSIVVWYGGAFALFMVAIVIMGIKTRHLNRDVERTNETVRVLGNSYYGLYRVNYKEGKYERIKGSDYSRTRLEPKGDYQDLIEAVGDMMDEDTRQEFKDSFSLDHVQQMVRDHVREYGGDFWRQFNQKAEWVNISLLSDPSLSPEEMVLCLKEVDVEKRRQLQHMKLIEDALDSAKSSEESQKRFFANMSHDMRTPLNVIIGMSDMALQDGQNEEKIRNYLKKINISSRQLLALINDILEMSRLEQGRISLEREKFNLTEAMELAAAPFQTQAGDEEKKFSLSCDIQDTWVYGDAPRLSQVMNNLFSNAVKFTAPGGTITANIRQIQSKGIGMYQIVVKDTGIGMSEEYLPHLFVPYERETRFGEKKIGGTGLGMPIVKMIVSKMGGQITVDSAVGVGTTFTLVLPFEIAEEENIQDKQADDQKPAYTLNRKRILLVEDYDLNMEIATDILEMQGVIVTQAWNGREAVEKFEASRYKELDAILMDMQMPEMNGCQATEAIRMLPRPDARQIPIIALTANAFAEDIALTKKAGMDAHISKPIDVDMLCRTLGDLIGARQKKIH